MVLRFASESALTRLVTGVLGFVGMGVHDTALHTIEYRFAVGSLAILVLIGLVIYWRIPDPAKSGLTDPDSQL